MTSRRSTLLSSVLAVVALAAAAPALSQSYGLGDQVLALGATDFRPVNNTTTYSFNLSDGYLYGPANYLGPLTLPNGAEIFQVCVYANVPDAGSPVAISLIAAKLAPGGESPGVVAIDGGFVQDAVAIGYGTVCTAPFSYTFHETADIDNDGTSEHIVHFFEASISGSGGLGGARVFWRRQITPAPAFATFNDVPQSDPGFPFVEALVRSGITAGCGGGNYCPNATLTRRQMAVFLATALGLHWQE